MLYKAVEIATNAHKGQVDKGGVDYINHPKAVADKVSTVEQKIVAYLHDVVEDTNITLEDLKNYGFSQSIIEAIDCISKNDKNYFDYLAKVKSNPLARIVKIADLEHNMDLSRLQSIKLKDIERLENIKRQNNI